MGEHSWLTVVSPEDPDGAELLLEPTTILPSSPFKAALVPDGIPFTSFAVADVGRSPTPPRARRHSPNRPPRWGRSPPPSHDTCGNLIQIASM